MPEIIINPDGLVECHLREDLEELIHSGVGIPTFERLTEVYWEPGDSAQGTRGEWVARLKATGEKICSGWSRAAVVREEAAFVESLKWRR